ncbi:MAG: sterol desaturase family protein [Verrucomicrobiota bacterium]
MDLGHKLLALLVLGLVFYVIERVLGNRRRARPFRPGMTTDALYFVFASFVKLLPKFLLAVPAVLLIALQLATPDGFRTGTYRGFGPVLEQPRWLQVVEIYLLVDFSGYWIHRLFHTGAWWPFHAVHHSSEDLDWLSSVRVHPVNDIVDKFAQATPVLLLGFDPLTTLGTAGFFTFYAIFLHADVDWDFGPLRSVIATPVFHRWHHSKDPQAVDRNFAGLLPLWDILFGTYYMPRDRTPCDFGVPEKVPAGFFGQLWHPFAGWFRRKGPPAA